jgi:hypothetical protein
VYFIGSSLVVQKPLSRLVANESLGGFFNAVFHRHFAVEALFAHHPFASRCFCFTGSRFLAGIFCNSFSGVTQAGVTLARRSALE